VFDLFFSQRARPNEQRVLIYGASDAGAMALRWILMNADFNYRPVGLLDDDPLMYGRLIHGVEVLGGSEELETILERGQIEGLILAGERANARVSDDLTAACRRHGCWVRRLRLEFEILE
jgi:FlaA1/EpsC-like NDP-sugar epimerase